MASAPRNLLPLYSFHLQCEWVEIKKYRPQFVAANCVQNSSIPFKQLPPVCFHKLSNPFLANRWIPNVIVI